MVLVKSPCDTESQTMFLAKKAFYLDYLITVIYGLEPEQSLLPLSDIYQFSSLSTPQQIDLLNTWYENLQQELKIILQFMRKTGSISKKTTKEALKSDSLPS